MYVCVDGFGVSLLILVLCFCVLQLPPLSSLFPFFFSLFCMHVLYYYYCLIHLRAMA